MLRVHAPETDGLNRLLHVTNRVVQEHGQPPLYAKVVKDNTSYQPSGPVRGSSTPIRGGPDSDWSGMQDVSEAFHISIAWTLEPPSNNLLDTTGSISSRFADANGILIRVGDIKVKVGNVVTSVRLQRNVSERSNLLGL